MGFKIRISDSDPQDENCIVTLCDMSLLRDLQYPKVIPIIKQISKIISFLYNYDISVTVNYISISVPIFSFETSTRHLNLPTLTM